MVNTILDHWTHIYKAFSKNTVHTHNNMLAFLMLLEYYD